ncbi:ABC transporter ATP-binding protein [Bifidobacterium biavatii]|uniref:Multidrug ABC transporter ATP-binding protein n=1 Tax=Bifidobacterium biavatii DSM 23969 TaxID=1437608 RepID=A0A086ZNF2_9BIFI|nr:ABC transporter ATP-binding protein [Bifidobacterium biavatii]KFI48052.1 multidrug ABC transporter ATP-binding protein [Bifidobacterium biavatii DSM 23969]
MLRIMKYLSKAEIGQMLIALVTIVGQIWFDLELPDYMSDITTLVETPGSEMRDIWIAGGKMLLVSLGSVACAVVTGYIAARVASSFGQRLRSLEFRKVESFGPAEMSRFSTASLITRSTNDITQIQMFITMGLQLIVKSPIMAVWAIMKIAGDGFEWTLATAIATVILLIAIAVLMALVMPKFKAMQQLTDNINLVARENLTGLRVVRAYNAEDYQEAKFTKANKDLTDTQLFTNRAMAVMMPLMNTVMNGLMLAVYWIGASLIDAAALTDKLTVFSNMVVFSSYSVQVIMSFLMMSMVFVLWPRADVSAQRVLEVLDTDPLVTNGRDTAADVARIGGNQTGTVEFRDVSFTYPDSREPILEHVSFEAKRGQTVAFIGATGSGKTSLINLVPRLYDVSAGQVLVDGVDVRDWNLTALRDRIGYVPQKSVLFKGTVTSNVSYGDRPGKSGTDDATVALADTSTAAGRRREAAQLAADAANDGKLTDDERRRVREAADVAQATEFVERMDDGFDSAIAQGGSNVSGGQKQRLSIARAVYRNPEILIFDDSFSALDFATDRNVRDALAEHAKDATKLIVAQRIGTIMNADRIVVLDDGRVVGQGTHRELLDTCDVYRQIAESQLSKAELTA